MPLPSIAAAVGLATSAVLGASILASATSAAMTRSADAPAPQIASASNPFVPAEAPTPLTETTAPAPAVTSMPTKAPAAPEAVASTPRTLSPHIKDTEMHITPKKAAAASATAIFAAAAITTQVANAAPTPANVPHLQIYKNFIEGGPATWSGSLSADAPMTNSGFRSTYAANLIAGAEPHRFPQTFYGGGLERFQPPADVCSTTPVAPDSYSLTRSQVLPDDLALFAWCRNGSPVAVTELAAGYLALPDVPTLPSGAKSVSVADGSTVTITGLRPVGRDASTAIGSSVGRPFNQEPIWRLWHLQITDAPAKGSVRDPEGSVLGPNGLTADPSALVYRANAGATGSDSFSYRLCAGWVSPTAVCSASKTVSVSIT